MGTTMSMATRYGVPLKVLIWQDERTFGSSQIGGCCQNGHTALALGHTGTNCVILAAWGEGLVCHIDGEGSLSSDFQSHNDAVKSWLSRQAWLSEPWLLFGIEIWLKPIGWFHSFCPSPFPTPGECDWEHLAAWETAPARSQISQSSSE